MVSKRVGKLFARLGKKGHFSNLKIRDSSKQFHLLLENIGWTVIDSLSKLRIQAAIEVTRKMAQNTAY